MKPVTLHKDRVLPNGTQFIIYLFDYFYNSKPGEENKENKEGEI